MTSLVMILIISTSTLVTANFRVTAASIRYSFPLWIVQCALTFVDYHIMLCLDYIDIYRLTQANCKI